MKPNYKIENQFMEKSFRSIPKTIITYNYDVLNIVKNTVLNHSAKDRKNDNMIGQWIIKFKKQQ